MKITFSSSNAEVMKETGRRIKSERIAKSMTQGEMAEATGLSLRTISNLEGGKDVSFSTLIEVLRALGRVQGLDVLLPEQTIRPSQIAELGKARERASRRRNKGPEETGWKCDDDE